MRRLMSRTRANNTVSASGLVRSDRDVESVRKAKSYMSTTTFVDPVIARCRFFIAPDGEDAPPPPRRRSDTNSPNDRSGDTSPSE